MNLLIVLGQDVVCDGVCGALMAGVLTALAVDPFVAADLATSYVVHYL
jgi:hypothetical protein